jgi:P4 family phage/plasmid primase-like protien
VTHQSPFNELLTRLGRSRDDVRLITARGKDLRSFIPAPEDIDTAVEAAVENDEHVWYEINPSSFREDHGRSSARHITRLVTLYVDVDYKDGGMGSLEVAHQLIDDLTGALGAAPAAIVSTGNGLQPYWPITDGDMPDEASRTRVLTVLARFKALVDMFAAAHGGKIDSLFDLPRIFRVPGSLNVKDADNPKPVTVVFPEGSAAFELAELEEIFDDYGIDAQPRKVAAEPVSGMAEWDWAEHDCHFAATFREEILHAPVTARHPWMLAHVAVLHGMIRYGCLTESTFEELRSQIDHRHADLCRSQAPVREPEPREYVAALRWGAEQASRWTATQLIDEMRSHTHTDFLAMFTTGVREQLPPSAQTPPEPPAPPVISLFTKQPLPAAPVQSQGLSYGSLALQPTPQSQARLTVTAHTDSGNAELFAHAIAGRFMFVSGIGWHLWDGSRWIEDTGARVREALKDLFTVRLQSATDLDEQQWLRQSLNSARMTATLKWAESVPAVQAYPYELDRNPMELVTPGGIVSLADRTIRPASPLQDRNTKITAAAPDWSRRPARFLQVLQFAFGHDPELIGYVQRLFGLSLIGELRAQIFPIFHGSGANGKSLLFQIFLAILGSYGMKLGQTFLVQTRGEQHPEQIAALRGVRLALASEVPVTAKFNEELVKALTGDAKITARKLYENSAEHDNATTLMLAANHLPTVTGGGPAWWRRQRLIAMPNVMPEEQQDDTLGDTIIREEGGAVLAWMIDGAAAYLTQGEQVPASVKAATHRYRIEEDALARFIDTHLVFDPTSATTRQSVYMQYQMWANTNRIFPMLSEPKFAREFITIHPSVQIPGDETQYLGVALQARAPEAIFDPLAAIYA